MTKYTVYIYSSVSSYTHNDTKSFDSFEDARNFIKECAKQFVCASLGSDNPKDPIVIMSSHPSSTLSRERDAAWAFERKDPNWINLY